MNYIKSLTKNKGANFNFWHLEQFQYFYYTVQKTIILGTLFILQSIFEMALEMQLQWEYEAPL